MPRDQKPRSRGRKPREFTIIVKQSDETVDIDAFLDRYLDLVLAQAWQEKKERKGSP